VSTFTTPPIFIETTSSIAAKRLIREGFRQSAWGEMSLDPLTVQAKPSEWPVSAATLQIISAYTCFETVDPPSFRIRRTNSHVRVFAQHLSLSKRLCLFSIPQRADPRWSIGPSEVEAEPGGTVLANLAYSPIRTIS
jgi:hypothetical protein